MREYVRFISALSIMYRYPTVYGRCTACRYWSVSPVFMRQSVTVLHGFVYFILNSTVYGRCTAGVRRVSGRCTDGLSVVSPVCTAVYGRSVGGLWCCTAVYGRSVDGLFLPFVVEAHPGHEARVSPHAMPRNNPSATASGFWYFLAEVPNSAVLVRCRRLRTGLYPSASGYAFGCLKVNLPQATPSAVLRLTLGYI